MLKPLWLVCISFEPICLTLWMILKEIFGGATWPELTRCSAIEPLTELGTILTISYPTYSLWTVKVVKTWLTGVTTSWLRRYWLAYVSSRTEIPTTRMLNCFQHRVSLLVVMVRLKLTLMVFVKTLLMVLLLHCFQNSRCLSRKSAKSVVIVILNNTYFSVNYLLYFFNYVGI